MMFNVIVQGFDEFMNLVIDDAEEFSLKNNTKKNVGRIMLKGENVSLIMTAQEMEGNLYFAN